MDGKLTQAQYAKAKGVSRQAVHKLVKSGVIPLTEDGLVDPVIADAKALHLLNPGRSKITGSMIQPSPVGGSVDPFAVPSSLNAAKLQREHYAGLREKLEYEKLLGGLLERETVEREMFEAARMLRDGVLNVAKRIAPQLAAMNDAGGVEQLLHAELRRVLDNFSRLAAQSLGAESN